MTDEVNTLVNAFVARMKSELIANEHKGGWTQLNMETSIKELTHHFTKLLCALADADKTRINEYSADVANCAMFVCHANGGMKPGAKLKTESGCDAKREPPPKGVSYREDVGLLTHD